MYPLLWERFIPRKCKLEIYKTILNPKLLHGAEVLAQNTTARSTLQGGAEIGVLRAIKVGTQLGKGSWGSKRLPLSAKEQRCPFCSALFIQDRPSLTRKKRHPKILFGSLPQPPIFFSAVVTINKNHKLSKALISVNLPQYYLHFEVM